MNTPYKNVTDRFLNKIKKDTSFFSYKGLPQAELEAVITQRANILLDDSVLYLQSVKAIEQDVDFTNKDDMLLQFNFSLTKLEEDLLSDIMILKLYEEELLVYKKKQEYIGRDINIFSPATDRTSFLNILTFITESVNNKIDNYNSMDRLTGKILLPYNVNDFNYDF